MGISMRYVILLFKYLCASLEITRNLASICKAFLVIYNSLTFDCDCKSLVR